MKEPQKITQEIPVDKVESLMAEKGINKRLAISLLIDSKAVDIKELKAPPKKGK